MLEGRTVPGAAPKSLPLRPVSIASTTSEVHPTFRWRGLVSSGGVP